MARKEASAAQVLSQVYPPFHARPAYKEQRRAVVVVDMLHDFVYGKLATKRMIPRIPNVAALLDAARAGGVPVVYCNDSHKKSDFELYRWEPHAMRGTKGAEVIPQLAPKKSDFIVPKSTYSSFHETELDDVLRSAYGGRGANTLVIAGVTTDCCVLHTSAEAFFRRYQVEVVEDGVEAFTALQHQTGLHYIKNWYLCDVLPSKQLVKRIGR